MSYSTVIAAIDTIIKTATGVNTPTIYKYVKLATNWADFISAFKDTTNSVIHGYMITRTRIEEVPEASRVNHVLTTWAIYGFYALKSDGTSESTFQGVIDNIRTKFRDDPRLGSTVLTSTPIQADTIEQRMFGDVLCHYVEMRLVTEEEEQFT